MYQLLERPACRIFDTLTIAKNTLSVINDNAVSGAQLIRFVHGGKVRGIGSPRLGIGWHAVPTRAWDGERPEDAYRVVEFREPFAIAAGVITRKAHAT